MAAPTPAPRTRQLPLDLPPIGSSPSRGEGLAAAASSISWRLRAPSGKVDAVVQVLVLPNSLVLSMRPGYFERLQLMVHQFMLKPGWRRYW